MTRPLMQATYDSTFRSVADALRAGDPLEVAAAALGHVGGTVDGFHRLTGAEVACQAGCSFCCWLRVDVRAHEVLLIRRYLAGDRWVGDRGALEAKVRVVGARVAGLTAPAERAAVRQPCALLDHAGCCTVYAVRPAACRRYLSVSVDACEAIWNDGTPAVEPEHPVIAEAGRHAAAGAHNAFVAAGFDGFSYDLMAALAEALEDPECEARWRLKQPAFSERARSAVPDGFSQEEAVARLRAELAGEGGGKGT